jgi:hypothetical protein
MVTNDHDVDCSRTTWRKSTRSSANGECVEIAAKAGTIAVRDSKHPDGSKLIIARHDWTAFVRDIKAGQQDC